MWYNEVKLYKWNHPGYNPKTAHFTQLVWQGTKRVGFGRAKYVNGKFIICGVCNMTLSLVRIATNEIPADVT